jgi:hypothetical protein
VRVIALSGELPEIAGHTVFPPELRHVMERDAFVLNDMRAQAADGLARGWLRPDGGEAREPVEMPLQGALPPHGGRAGRLLVPARDDPPARTGSSAASSSARRRRTLSGERRARGREIADCVALAPRAPALAERRSAARRRASGRTGWRYGWSA